MQQKQQEGEIMMKGTIEHCTSGHYNGLVNNY